MKTKLNLLIIAAAITCVRCADFDHPDSGQDGGSTQNVEKPEPKEVKAVEPQDIKDALTIQVQPTPKPERYMVYFSWPQLPPDKRLRIRQDQTLSTAAAGQTTFSHEVDHNQTLTYNIDILDSNSKLERSFAKQVQIPRDFVIRSGQDHFDKDEKLEFQRVYLSSEIPLQTNGFNIEIQTNELHSDHGLIQTFKEGATAPPGIPGRSGGSITIHSPVATGDLLVVLRGENGGIGPSGPAYSSRAPDGAAPGPGVQECTCGKNCILRNFCHCNSNGDSGHNGANGSKGYPGGNGAAGGDTGTLKIDIQDGSAFHIETQSLPGLGGSPGTGGPGQPGGIALTLPNPNSCSGQPGTNGQPGPLGDSGSPGESGKKEQICIAITSEGRNDCY